MGIKMTNFKEFEKYLNEIRDKEFPDYIVDTLDKLGKSFMVEARNKERPKGAFAFPGELKISHYNWTMKLVNSVGFGIAHNGVLIKHDFDTNTKTTPTYEDWKGETEVDEGKAEGLRVLKELVPNVKGYTLICVAGMEYGLYVEAKGYDVITGSVKSLIQELKKW